MANVVCVWCQPNHVIGHIPGPHDSHGLCTAAKDRELAKIRNLPEKEPRCPHGDPCPAQCTDCAAQRLGGA